MHLQCRIVLGAFMLHDLFVAFFLMLAGLTASGIVSNLYRLSVVGPGKSPGRGVYLAVMVVAGPTVLFNNATSAFLKKECSQAAFWLATALTSYWSLVIGMFVVSLAQAV